jgi:hypothetical protein
MRSPFLVGLSAAASALACGCDFSLGTGSAGAGGGGGSATVPTDCGQASTCPVSQECLAIVQNAGSPRFGLRIAELGVQTPAVFAHGFLASVLSYWFGPSLPGCAASWSSLWNWSGASSWLLRFDLGAGTLTMGGAAPPADPAQGYTFFDGMVPQGAQVYHAAPVTFVLVTSPDGSLGTAAPQDLDLAMFFPAGKVTRTGPVVLPLHALAASNVVVSPSHDCIGRCDPADFTFPQCLSVDPNALYLHGGHLESYVSLEEADAISISAAEQSLCVLLTGDSFDNCDGIGPVCHCKRTGGVIDFKGDWCSQTNAPATATCADAVRFAADFAASAVTILP